MNRRFLIALLFCLPCLCGRAVAQDAGGGRALPAPGVFSAGVSYPGVSLRYFTAANRAAEALFQAQSGVSVLGARYYFYPASLRSAGFWPYWALEADYLDFRGDYSRGKGWGGGICGGVERPLGRRISVQADAGIMYVSVEDKATSLAESGVEFLLNLGINFHFGGKK